MKTVTLAIVTAIVAGVAFGTLTATGVWKLNDFGNNAAISTQALPAEKSGMYGIVYYTLKDKDGNIKLEKVVNNRIIDGGEDIIQKAFSGGIAAGSVVDTVCIGLGQTAAAEADAGVETVVLGPGATVDGCLEDASVTIPAGQTGATVQTVEVDATFIGGTQINAGTAVGEAVLADTDPGIAGIAGQDPTAAQTFARQIFTPITVASGDSLTVKWTISITEP